MLSPDIKFARFLVKLAHERIFSWRTPGLAKVGSNLNAKNLLGIVPDF